MHSGDYSPTNTSSRCCERSVSLPCPARSPIASVSQRAPDMPPVRIAFERRLETLPLASLLPLRTIPPEWKQSVKYKRIARSVLEIGMIEPLVVAPSADQDGRFLLLDGHLRHAVLSDAGA